MLIDGPAPNVRQSAYSDEFFSTLLWVSESGPASNEGSEDMAPAGRQLSSSSPYPGGNIFRITEIPPDNRLDPKKVDMSKGPGFKVTEAARKRHFMSHRTDTLDYAIVLEGEIWAVLDEDEVRLTAGDVLIQRGTMHAWSNRSDKVCRMAFVMLDAHPLTNID